MANEGQEVGARGTRGPGGQQGWDGKPWHANGHAAPPADGRHMGAAFESRQPPDARPASPVGSPVPCIEALPAQRHDRKFGREESKYEGGLVTLPGAAGGVVPLLEHNEALTDGSQGYTKVIQRQTAAARAAGSAAGAGVGAGTSFAVAATAAGLSMATSVCPGAGSPYSLCSRLQPRMHGERSTSVLPPKCDARSCSLRARKLGGMEPKR